ncbi:MAG: hypothetical protein RIF41_28315, partial [Polyangiaceae bacterium]
AGATPFSMAVSRAGVAHVLYTDGRIYAVDVTNASCEATTFVPDPIGDFALFGMSYARTGSGETLFVASPPSARTSQLARVNVDGGTPRPVGRMSVTGASSSLIELTATRHGLWGFVTTSSSEGMGALVEIDRDTAAIRRRVPLPVGQGATALALAWWAGHFYVFTHTEDTVVTRFDPRTKQTRSVARIDERIVGAGTATCVPAV